MRFSPIWKSGCSLLVIAAVVTQVRAESKDDAKKYLAPTSRAVPAPQSRGAGSLFGGFGARDRTPAAPAATGAYRGAAGGSGVLSDQSRGYGLGAGRPAQTGTYRGYGGGSVLSDQDRGERLGAGRAADTGAYRDYGRSPGVLSDQARGSRLGATTARPAETGAYHGYGAGVGRSAEVRSGSFGRPNAVGAVRGPITAGVGFGREGGFAGRAVVEAPRRFSPVARFAGVAPGRMLPGAVPERNLIEHREQFAQTFGPGHDPVRDRAFVAGHLHDFHTHDVRAFNHQELQAWGAGRWHQDWHYGRWGWWYDVGDVWYPYAVPVYPYPPTVSEIVVPDTTEVDSQPEAVVDSSGTPVAVPAAPVPTTVAVASATGSQVVVSPLPAAPNVDYQCPTPDGNYPVVRLCPGTWVVIVK